jgi:hypothetical protein
MTSKSFRSGIVSSDIFSLLNMSSSFGNAAVSAGSSHASASKNPIFMVLIIAPHALNFHIAKLDKVYGSGRIMMQDGFLGSTHSVPRLEGGVQIFYELYNSRKPYLMFWKLRVLSVPIDFIRRLASKTLA